MRGGASPPQAQRSVSLKLSESDGPRLQPDQTDTAPLEPHSRQMNKDAPETNSVVMSKRS